MVLGYTQFLIKGGKDMQIKKNKKILFLTEVIIFAIGFGILSVFGYKRISRELYNCIDGVTKGCILPVGKILGESAALFCTAGLAL
mgnify:FL=1